MCCMQGCAFTSATCSAARKDCENSCTVNVMRAESYLVAEDRSFSPNNWRMCPELTAYIRIIAQDLSSESSVRKLLVSEVCIHLLSSPVPSTECCTQVTVHSTKPDTGVHAERASCEQLEAASQQNLQQRCATSCFGAWHHPRSPRPRLPATKQLTQQETSA